jgi:hypothetical protein
MSEGYRVYQQLRAYHHQLDTADADDGCPHAILFRHSDARLGCQGRDAMCDAPHHMTLGDTLAVTDEFHLGQQPADLCKHGQQYC